ncbi:polysaccharide deacetylase family protein [Paenibacillus allorhizosphaerae]|uniref:NodB homology domain-containing protein n=1 Tax=Paenibacillus allorhizosphaerae TaxID=2849866 RepID=A0ABM8VHD1_9BACL|nr:polysaccharide deacetylase family protein [Paenibacillus allorhizosphaerae]CAG7641491.1 hypothetical protein PAECIP111802_02747 [Paenibacillus allorhizosphaerae]
MSIKWTLIAAAALLFCSCSAKPAATGPAPSGPSSNSQAPEQKAPDALPLPRAEGQDIAKEPAQPPIPVPAAAPEQPKGVSKTYKLNPKSYDIVPINPEATEKKIVLLTFDDGPKDLEMNTGLLDTLDKHKAKAIFFVNGYRVKQKPELIKLLSERGQTIGNHSWDHIDLKKESKEKVDAQIGDVQKAIQDITGKAPSFFRPPFGSGSDEVRAKAKEEHLLYMTWSNGSKDWEMSSKNNNPKQVVGNVLEQLRPGSNILMHELPWTVLALDELLTKLEEKGYGFVDPEAIDINL